MRRWAAVLAIVFCLTLAGCSGGQATLQPALDLRASLLGAGGCRFHADVSADYGETVYEFSVDCAYDGENGTISVTAPETIEGISATVSGEDAVLTFDGTTLALEDLAGGQVAPLTLPWLFGSAWKSDYISAVGSDGDRYRVTILKGYGEDEIQLDTWLEDGTPVYGEVTCGGQRVLAVTFEKFAFSQ